LSLGKRADDRALLLPEIAKLDDVPHPLADLSLRAPA
jgi:hypothetical protein